MQYLTQHPHNLVGSVLIGLSVVNSYRETPGPIPNPEAKPVHADGTATGRLRESKSPPTPNNKQQQNKVCTERGKDTDSNGVLAPLLRDPRIFYTESHENSCTGGNRSCPV